MIPLGPTSVGGVRAKRFEGATVVRGLVLTGEFCEDDGVDAIHMGKITNPTVVEPVPFNPDLPFETVIGAHLYKGPVKAG